MVLASSAVDDTKARHEVELGDKMHVNTADSELLKHLRAGEERAYETLVRSLGPKVLVTARRYLRSEADVADCFQNTFLAVFENIDKFEQRSSLAAWVRGITINQCLMTIRKQERRQEQSIEHLLPDFDSDGKRIESVDSAQSSVIGQVIDTTRLKSIVREKIDELPDDHRLVLLLRDIDGYSTKETATILRIEINATKTRLHRARSVLRSLLTTVFEHLK